MLCCIVTAAEENIVQTCTWYIDFINTAADVLIGTINTQSKLNRSKYIAINYKIIYIVGGGTALVMGHTVQ